MHVDDTLQNLLELVLIGELCIIWALEGEPGAQHDVQDHSTAPQICGLSIICLALLRPIGDNLGRHISRGAHSALGSALQVPISSGRT